jgi:hypothetical protein
MWSFFRKNYQVEAFAKGIPIIGQLLFEPPFAIHKTSATNDLTLRNA